MSLNTQDTLILCATSRLARSLQLVHQRHQLEDGKTQWQSPTISTLSLWLNAVVEAAILQGEVDADSAPLFELNTTQEGLLWEQSIAYALKQHTASALFDTAGLASAAMEANRLLIEWNLSVNMENATEETRQFMQWRQRFQALCRETNGLEAVRYNNWQLTCLEKGAGVLPKQIQLAGFDRINPQLQRLIDILNGRGVEITNYPTSLPTPQLLTHNVFNNQDAECRAAIAWAQVQLKQNAKLAIVVPQLEILRDKLTTLLDDVFHPQAASPAFYGATRCYDFTLGVPLSTVLIISTALDLLRLAWQKRPLIQTDVSRLIQSPYWSNSMSEADARAKLDARMRSQLPLSFTTARLTTFIQQTIENGVPLGVQQLHTDLKALVDEAMQHSRQQLPSLWVNTFKQALKLAHWPGERSLSSDEYQATQSFERVLGQLTNLDSLLGKTSPNEAIKRLTQLVQAQIFQPESEATPAIQIMGMLEAAAEPLDAIWVMGMNDHIWPPVARTNALIPAELQRRSGTPNASSEVQTAFALAVHTRLTKSAKQVIFSSSEKEGDRLLRVSPMMQDIPSLNNQIEQAQTLAEHLAANTIQDWQWLDDHQAPQVNVGEHVSGGTSLLKAQAICPAWAFYQYRLGARQLDEPTNGLDVMERGNLVHAVLAQFWQNKTSLDLEALTEFDLKSCLKSISDQVLIEFNQEHGNTFSEAFLSLEAERLTKLVSTWILEVEMIRPQPFTVTACEQAYKTNIEGISIKLVIDRIDTLDDGKLVVLDYKTGRQIDYKNWADDQITEPQLPIYAAFLLEDSEIAAVCFARVRSAEHAFVGIASTKETLPGAVVFDDKRGRKLFDEHEFPDWGSIIQHWKIRITATAQSLKSGDAAVVFKDEKQLAYCEVLPLLRLPERQLQFEHANAKSE
jgi:probable DNA repair protein